MALGFPNGKWDGGVTVGSTNQKGSVGGGNCMNGFTENENVLCFCTQSQIDEILIETT